MTYNVYSVVPGMRPRVAVDLDGVVFNYGKAFIERIIEDGHESSDILSLKGTPEWADVFESLHEKYCRLYFSDTAFWKNIPKYPEYEYLCSLPCYARPTLDIDPVFITSRPEGAREGTLQALPSGSKVYFVSPDEKGKLASELGCVLAIEDRKTKSYIDAGIPVIKPLRSYNAGVECDYEYSSTDELLLTVTLVMVKLGFWKFKPVSFRM